MKLSVKALSFVLRAAGSEHDMSPTRRVFTYVVGGRVGMNDTCYFTLDMKKLDPTPLQEPCHVNSPPMKFIIQACDDLMTGCFALIPRIRSGGGGGKVPPVSISGS